MTNPDKYGLKVIKIFGLLLGMNEFFLYWNSTHRRLLGSERTPGKWYMLFYMIYIKIFYMLFASVNKSFLTYKLNKKNPENNRF